MNNQSSLEINVYPRYLWFLMVSYVVVILLANWFDARLILIGPYPTDAGTLIFPFTFLLSDLITEVFGYKHARRAIWCGLLFNIIYMSFGYIVTHMPSPSFATHNALFDELLVINSRIIFASILSYMIAEPLNSYLMAKTKIYLNGRYMGIRFITSTFIASGFDSGLFTILAFYGVFPTNELLTIGITMWVLKVLIELVLLPISTRIAVRLKQSEQLDIFDERTKFGIFNLNAQYSTQENKYGNYQA